VVCGAPLDHKPVGRIRIQCSDACRSRAKRARKTDTKLRGLVRLYEGDARAFLAGLADESVDLILTDPPYEFDRGGTYFRDWFADLPDDAWPEVLAECYRVLRDDRHAYVICDRRTEEVFIAAAVAAGFRYLRRIIWNKGTPALGQGVYRSQYEVVLLFSKGTRPGNSRHSGDVLTFPRVMTRGHYPTEKPVGLLQTLIGQSSLPGELVLDPFCGSGSTGRAARELGRRGAALRPRCGECSEGITCRRRAPRRRSRATKRRPAARRRRALRGVRTRVTVARPPWPGRQSRPIDRDGHAARDVRPPIDVRSPGLNVDRPDGRRRHRIMPG